MLIPFFKIPHIFWVFDPFVILTRAFVLKGAWIVIFGLIVIISVLIPKFWCNNICPLGGLYYLIGVKIRYLLRAKTELRKRNVKKKRIS